MTPLPGPALDVHALHGLRACRRDLTPILRRIRTHLDTHEGYLAFSGGKDSLVVLHLARQVAPDLPVVFFDSGLEYPETYSYIADLADGWDLTLDVVPARPSALEVLIGCGLWDHAATGPDTTGTLHDALITVPAAAAHRRYGPGELWGVRAAESRGRHHAFAAARVKAPCTCSTRCSPRAHRHRHGGTITRRDGTTAYSPIWDWPTTDVWGYLHHHGVPANPVYARLAAIGAPEHALRLTLMLDGGHLTTGRLTWLRRGWPTLFDELAECLPRIREYV